jgi:2-polyprenyl-3-methyl-5-hydroxy-6-metoxy-1,4-benzoquinol methylase
MPTSDSWGKDWVCEVISKLDKSLLIESVLDIGAGEGTYSDLLHPVLCNNCLFAAVEVWGPYVSEFNLDKKYEQVIVGDARFLEENVFSYYNLIILGDVLEHMPHRDAKYLLEKIFSSAGGDKIILISVPMLHLEQGAVNGNPYEIHKMDNHYTLESMLDMIARAFHGKVMLDIHVGDVLGYFLVRTGEYIDVDLGSSSQKESS